MEKADASQDDALAVNSDDAPTAEDGVQDYPQCPIAEDEVSE